MQYHWRGASITPHNYANLVYFSFTFSFCSSLSFVHMYIFTAVNVLLKYYGTFHFIACSSFSYVLFSTPFAQAYTARKSQKFFILFAGTWAQLKELTCKLSLFRIQFDVKRKYMFGLLTEQKRERHSLWHLNHEGSQNRKRIHEEKPRIRLRKVRIVDVIVAFIIFLFIFLPFQFLLLCLLKMMEQ